MIFFTGFPNSQTFMLLFSFVSSVFPASAKQSLKPAQELLLTLMKLHLNLSEDFLGIFRDFRDFFRILWDSPVNSIESLSPLDTCHGKQASSPNIVARKRGP